MKLLLKEDGRLKHRIPWCIWLLSQIFFSFFIYDVFRAPRSCIMIDLNLIGGKINNCQIKSEVNNEALILLPIEGFWHILTK